MVTTDETISCYASAGRGFKSEKEEKYDILLEQNLQLEFTIE